MDRTPLTSKNLASAGYDPETWTLEVEFANGAIYQYQRVPPEVYATLREDARPGQFFARYIKLRYPYGRMA